MRCTLAAAGLCIALGSSNASFLNPMKHDIFKVTAKQFDRLIDSHRNGGAAVVAFCDQESKCRAFLDGAFNDLASDAKGMVKVGAMECTGEDKKFCKDQLKESDAALPQIMIYPPQPFPPYVWTGALEKGPIFNALLKLIPGNHVKTLTQSTPSEMNAFMSTNIAVPKVLLFSAKDTPPVLYNALSNSFHDRMTFGFICAEKAKQYKEDFHVTALPSLIVYHGEKSIKAKKGDVYSGEMKFQLLHEFLNIRSETFVKGGGFETLEEPLDAKPWLMHKVPELTIASHRDVCFKSSSLCVIYLGNPDENTVKMLESLKEDYDATTSNRTAKFTFSYMNLGIEKNFAKLFDIPADKESLVVFNPHKRLRYMKLDSTLLPTKENIEKLIDKILGGDARFTNVPGSQLPAFVVRQEEGNRDIKKEEL
eukprot:Lankesteria_metandrocarpae@DN904_c0_g1_i1.p1